MRVPEAGVAHLVEEGSTGSAAGRSRTRRRWRPARRRCTIQNSARGQRDAEERQRPGQVPQDRPERDRPSAPTRPRRTAGCCPSRASACSVSARAGGDDVDVVLDALIGVVDRFADEPTAVVGVSAEPVVEERGRSATPATAIMKRWVRYRSSMTRHGGNGRQHAEDHASTSRTRRRRLSERVVAGCRCPGMRSAATRTGRWL